MSQSQPQPSSSTAPASGSSSVTLAVDLEAVVADITTTTSSQHLLTSLRSLIKRDVGETILASLMPGGQDPLSVLDTHVNTLGYLFILYVRYFDPHCIASDFVAEQQGSTSWGRLLCLSPQSHFFATPLMLKLHG